MARLIVFILIFAFFLAFIVLNLDNKCDISFGIKTLNDVPVFLSALCSFVLGMLITVPMCCLFMLHHIIYDFAIANGI